VARKRSPARLVIALSVAAALAVFLLYASISGGGTAMVQPSELAGHVVGVPKGDSYGTGLRFQVRDIKGGKTELVTVHYTGSVPDQFRPERDIVVDGRLQNGTFVAERDSLITKCPSKYAPET
jgi:cytochrome c-type biogenesis protein CcmE